MMQNNTIREPSGNSPLRRLHSASSTLSRHHPSMTLQMASSFLVVAMYPELSLVELEEVTGLRQQTISRHMQDLGPFMRHRPGGDESGRREGLGLIESYAGSRDQRTKHYRLTRKGIALATLLQNLVAG